MPGNGTEQRKLAAIMFTDMVGYSALSQRNEALALQLLEEHRSLLRALFPRSNGREVKTIGDAFLVEFHSALEAAQCAIEIQRTLAKRNHDVPAARRIEVRIGIHIGDVVQRADGDVLGDGVNIASRIEPLAGANGICISVDVERQIRNTIEASLVKLGATELKNIQVPMELFRIVLPWEPQPAAARASKQASTRRIPSRAWAVATAVSLILIGVSWFFFRKPFASPSSRPGTNTMASAPVVRSGFITSLAVLPLLNRSGDPQQEYFVDGITDALCTELAGLSALKKVTSRTTIMQYKGSKKNIPEIATELGVDALLEGSVRHEGNVVSVRVDLIDGATDRHLWQTSYEHEVSSVLILERQLAQAIAAEIRVKLTPEEQTHLASAPLVNPAAFEAYLQGRDYWYRFTPEGFQRAKEANLEAIRLDPEFGPAQAALARCYVSLSNTELLSPNLALQNAKQAVANALRLGESGEALEAQAALQVFLAWDWPGAKINLDRAQSLIPKDGGMHALASWYFIVMSRFSEARAEALRAADLEPRMPMAIACPPRVLLYQRHYQEAIEEYRKVFASFPRVVHVVFGLARAYERSGQPAKAVEVLEKALESGRAPMLLEGLASALAANNQRNEARKIAAELQTKYDQAIQTQQGYVSPWHLAVVSMALGEQQPAIEWLDRGFKEGAFGMLLLNVEPAFDGIRSDDRFQTLLRKMNIPP